MAPSFDLERELTSNEIAERGKLRDRLDEERDSLLTAVEDRRREIRGFNVSRKKIEAELRDVRRELRTGKVFESPQTSLAFEPPDDAPTVDDIKARLALGLRPPARHGEGELLDPSELRHLITAVRPRAAWPTVAEVKGWHEQVRADVQRWCRAEHARAHPIAGAPLPPVILMPNVLENVTFQREAQGGRKAPGKQRKKAAGRTAKPWPASGTPARVRRRK